MILGKHALLEAIEAKKIVISPFSPDQVGPGSIDLTLGREFREFVGDEELSVDNDYKAATQLLEQDEYLLEPGKLVLGITEETVQLSSELCGWLQGRSRFARLGLAVHITAAYMQPGIDNKQVLEIYNAGPHPIRLKAGVRIAQLVVEHCVGGASYAKSGSLFSEQESMR